MIRPVALVNGAESPLERASLAITDGGVQRGDGAFEAIGIWDARPFRLDDHLERLDRSLAAIGLPPAPAEALRADIACVMTGQTGDGALRVYASWRPGSGRWARTVPRRPRPCPTAPTWRPPGPRSGPGRMTRC
jgi:branched-subunit amino acid aminotransferase/4-amino-4-deoxychorismate lyase